MAGTSTHHHADLGDVILHYITAGDGFPVVLLHGIPQTSHEWRYVIPHLANKYKVIAPDLRGLGDSSHPTDGYDPRIASHNFVTECLTSSVTGGAQSGGF